MPKIAERGNKMNYQSIVEMLGIGLANRIMEVSLSDTEFDALTLAQKREFYETEGNTEKARLFLKRMAETTTSFKTLIWLLSESNWDSKDPKIHAFIFEKLMSQDLSVGK